jgi:transcriptional regulator with XRE-family HTH domain
VTPGELIRQRRRRHGLTQLQLARRAGTSQAAISRLERDEVSPTFSTLSDLLLVMGEAPELGARRLEADFDEQHLHDARARSPEDRVRLGWSWNRFAGEIAQAGAAARRGSDGPA